MIRIAAILLLLLLLTSCATSPPKNVNDSCAIFKDKNGWYKDALKSYKKWGIPVDIQLAIIYQESGFVHDAKPARKKLLWVIPWKRPSSAYGYGQSLDSTWDSYRKQTGNRGADRDKFSDVVDFIGWFGNQSYRKSGIAKNDAYNQYLAYHEGQGGFQKRSYRKKRWLMNVAKKVAKRSAMYRKQLVRCEDDLDTGWWPFW